VARSTAGSVTILGFAIRQVEEELTDDISAALAAALHLRAFRN
jgi:hypothetical protein